jgi:hypothetical protein
MSNYISSLNDPFNPRFKKDIIDLVEQLIREDKRKPGKKSEEPSTKQQILILHYLGILKQINLENTKKALLLSKLLSKNDQNIREYLTYINARKIEDSDIKTKNNLEAVRKIFEEIGLSNEVALVTKDLEKIDKIR